MESRTVALIDLIAAAVLGEDSPKETGSPGRLMTFYISHNYILHASNTHYSDEVIYHVYIYKSIVITIWGACDHSGEIP